MANTYTQLYLQIVFVVKSRENLIHERIREKVEKYICGIVSKHKSKPLVIYCNPDHLHLLTRGCIESPTSSLCLSSKWSFTLVNFHFSAFASLEFELSIQPLLKTLTLWTDTNQSKPIPVSIRNSKSH
ncbi:MAG: hypothetical protein CSA95_06065 [Bacteroidetes bacterium]|nr:MAG: hypothetical protein CSA95_06065 [Bacteroidota bacterium]PIE88739.1 MAG: hypothetical protein CSA04_00315 [Bacteroidota bacterium]